MAEKITRELAEYLLRKMMEIRQFEEKVSDLLGRNVVTGASHLYAGEEAVAVGACSVLRKDDVITSTHRGHGHCIAKGGELHLMLAELCGKATGYCRGRGGSMHIADVTAGNLGANGVVGGGLGMAAGAGLAIKMQKQDRVVICFFGDGATNQGLFHESMNMSATWNLPVIYLCENNLYGMSVAVSRCFPDPDISIRAKAYGIPGIKVDGMDVLAVREEVSRVIDLARKGKGPVLLVAQTYRYFGHSRSDPRVYRTKEEEKFWRDKCPIKQFSEKMIKQGVLTDGEVKALDTSVQKAIADAEKFALESPYPGVDELYDGLYV